MMYGRSEESILLFAACTCRVAELAEAAAPWAWEESSKGLALPNRTDTWAVALYRISRRQGSRDRSLRLTVTWIR
jgi:hypothetical protein